MVEDWIAAYAAGFFDGEGYVYLRNRPPHYTIGILIGQVDRRPLDFLAKHWGGGVLGPYYMDGGKHKNWRPQYQWGLHSRRAYDFLQDIYPWSILKLDQIELLLDYPFTAGGKELPPEIVQKRAEIYLAVKLAKKPA